MRHDGVFRSAEEAFDFEVLLDPFEEQFDLPALPVDFRDGQGCEAEVAGQELIRFSLVIHEFDESELARVFFDRSKPRISDAFVGDHAFLRQTWAVLSVAQTWFGRSIFRFFRKYGYFSCSG